MDVNSISVPPIDDPRTQELRTRLAAVQQRIDRAVARAGRADRPQLIVVTKFFPAEDVLRLLRLGVADVGENRDQEASVKAEEVEALLEAHSAAHPEAPLSPPCWHFIGQLQSNKARSVARYAAAVHSVDRSSLLKALRRVADVGSPLDCLIQVDLRQEIPQDSRGGATPAQVPELAASIASSENLRLAGLMAVAPLGEPPAPAFERLGELAAGLHAEHPQADMISAGMSNDLEEAVAHGATHLRIGRDVLGKRPLPR
ncbi:YggS family pyridoxal phosphate-dependent enzyme [Nesterenkonia suensis]